MSTAQLLLRRLIEQSGGAKETGYLLVLDGEGLDELPPELPTARGTHGVYRVSTEIALRHLLWKAQGAPLIAVMPEALAQRLQRVPDLLRPARNQRVHSLSANDVLEVVLGVRVVGAETRYLQELAMEYLGKLDQAISRRTLPTVVDRKLLTELLVDVSVGAEVRTEEPASLLASWLKEPPSWSENVSRLVRDSLPVLHGDAGRLLSWALEEPERRPRALVVHGAVLTVEGEVPKVAWGPLWRAAAEKPVKTDRRIVRRAVSDLAAEALKKLGEKAVAFLAEADRIGRETLKPDQLQTSQVLPLAFESRCHALAHRAANGQAIRAAEIVSLSNHLAAPLRPAEMAVLESTARLSRYLDAPSEPSSDVLAQVRSYQREGAFADLAMLHLRRALSGSAHYHAEAERVLAAVRERRDAENLRFAETLASGYETALHRAGLTPLHRIWKRVVQPVWERDGEARLYLVVLDGCSYPVFLELLSSLSQDATFPLGIRPVEEGSDVGQVAGLPALAPLPTVTSHSRGAIFLGQLPKDPLVSETVFRDQEEAKTDKARFRQNDGLGERSRQLFLKGDFAERPKPLYDELESETAVVAAVFNAVDDQIESSTTGAAFRLEAADIDAFKPSLRTALNSGRRVLVTADHGHTLFIDKSLRAGSGTGRRFLALGPQDTAPEGFLEIDLAALGGPPERRAFAWRSGVYLGRPKVGFHGGCSLEEMVVPLAWLERDGLHADEPAWWFGGQELPEAPKARAVMPPIETPVPSDVPVLQTSLFEPATRAASLPLKQELLARLTDDEKAALVLLHENGTARVSELANQLKKPPGRLQGLMQKLRRTLHAEGIVLFHDEKLQDGETMYRYQSQENNR